ncbi:DUF3265 domain-containing protein [Vibrio parahaemolyticus]|nr:DUF3265 domain-containing protein [Vibrio parahaemolyticus]
MAFLLCGGFCVEVQCGN